MHCKRRGSEKSTFLVIFWGLWFSQDRLFSRNSRRKPLNLIKFPIFTNTPCKSTCLCNAPSMHTVDKISGVIILDTGVFWAMIWGVQSACGEENVLEKTTSGIFLNNLQKSLWPAQSVQEEQRNDTQEGWKKYQTKGGGGLGPFFLLPSWGFPPPSWFSPRLSTRRTPLALRSAVLSVLPHFSEI